MKGPCGTGSAGRDEPALPRGHKPLALEALEELALLVDVAREEAGLEVMEDRAFVEDEGSLVEDGFFVDEGLLSLLEASSSSFSSSSSSSSFCSSVSLGLSSAGFNSLMKSRLSLILVMSSKLSVIAFVMSSVVFVRVSTTHLAALKISVIGFPLGLHPFSVP